MSDKNFDEYIREREGRKDYREAFADYYGLDAKETRTDRIPLEDGCSWVRMCDGSAEGDM